jgi:hypothetical protein
MSKTQEDADRITALAKEMFDLNRFPCMYMQWENLPASHFRWFDSRNGQTVSYPGRNAFLRQANAIYRYLKTTGELVKNVEE